MNKRRRWLAKAKRAQQRAVSDFRAQGGDIESLAAIVPLLTEMAALIEPGGPRQ